MTPGLRSSGHCPLKKPSDPETCYSMKQLGVGQMVRDGMANVGVASSHQKVSLFRMSSQVYAYIIIINVYKFNVCFYNNTKL